jgi:uncharacterized protein (TIGR01777 family)
MRIVLAGGSGFLGHALTRALLAGRHEVVVLSRGGANAITLNARLAAWTPNGETGPWARELDGADVVINLSGAGLADQRWSDDRKQQLRDSRVLSTRSLVAAMRAAEKKPSVFIQASGAGIYGAWDDAQGPFDEASPAGSDFLARLCVEWEAEAQPLSSLGTRLAIMRNGIVLARHGGALAQMLPPFHFFAGGPIATGRQYMAWITLEDWIRMVMWTIEDARVSGPVNATAPNPVSNREFARAIGRALHRPSRLAVPAFVLRLMFGEMATNILILGQRVVPARALDLGFRFEQPEVTEAMKAILS